MALTEQLADEARRQFTVCNACRYCEGFCPVFAALERDGDWSDARVEHLAHLCHDCRGCYVACMYTPPHEFAVDLPRLLQEVRLASYGRAPARHGDNGVLLASPRRRTPDAPEERAVVAADHPVRNGATVFAVVAAIVAALSLVSEGVAGLWRAHHSGSPYETITYPVLLALGLAASVFAAVLVGLRMWTRWKRTRSSPLGPRWFAVARAALIDAAALRQMHGGGPGCYARELPSHMRKYAHLALSYGVLSCLAATIAAAIEQDAIGREPPYPLFSAPVVLGLVGGVGIVLGCVVLTIVKLRADAAPTAPAMLVRDYGLLVGLTFVAATGLASLAVRDTAASSIVLVVHLAAVITLFVLVPYSKLMHAAYRFVALVVDRAELEQENDAVPST